MYYYNGHHERVSQEKADGGLTGEANVIDILEMLESEGCKSVTIDIHCLLKQLKGLSY